MANFFYGSAIDDSIAAALSPGVTTDPAGLTGTTEAQDLIYGYGGDDYAYAYGGDDRLYGGSGEDSLWGGEGSDILQGDAGDDHLDGWTGSDHLAGGTGDDTMFGGPNDDQYEVDSAGDVIGEAADEGWDVVYCTAESYTLSANVEELVLEGGLNGTGSAVGNYLTGNAWDNLLDGRGGDDEIWGKAGDDTATGGSGADQIFAGDDDDLLLGGSGNDLLEGDFGRDVLRGQSGDDVLRGGDRDADVLIGGGGADVFDYFRASWSPPGHRDRIRPGDGAPAFDGVGVAAGDLIDLSAIDADTTTRANERFAFGGAGLRHLTLSDDGRDTLVRGNTDLDTRFEIELVIEDGSSVSAADYAAADFDL